MTDMVVPPPDPRAIAFSALRNWGLALKPAHAAWTASIPNSAAGYGSVVPNGSLNTVIDSTPTAHLRVVTRGHGIANTTGVGGAR